MRARLAVMLPIALRFSCVVCECAMRLSVATGDRTSYPLIVVLLSTLCRYSWPGWRTGHGECPGDAAIAGKLAGPACLVNAAERLLASDYLTRIIEQFVQAVGSIVLETTW